MRLVLDPGVAKADVDRLSEGEGWILHDFVPPAEGEPYEKVWRAGEAAVHYLDDPVIRTRYLVVEGAGAERVADVVRRSLLVASAPEIAAGLAPGVPTATRQRFLFAAGLLGGELLPAILDALGDDDDHVRYAAALACGYANRPEALARLRPIAEGDPHQAVRDMAAAAVRGLERVAREGVR